MKTIIITLLITIIQLHVTAHAATWSFDPRISVEETYTDNVFLDSSNERDDFITEITPGINITGSGRNLQLDFDYQLQNLLYADDSDLNDEFSQLRATLESELIDDHLFFEADANIGQANISNQGRQANNNLNVTGNRTDTKLYRLTPIYRHSLGGIVDAELRYTFSSVKIDTGAGDSETDDFNIRLNNGRRFNRFNWSVAYRKSESDRSNTGQANADTDFESTNANLTIPLTQKYSFIVEAGSENSQFTTNQDRPDGEYIAAGIGYRPNSRFLLEVVGGERDRLTVNWQPSSRTSMQFTYNRQDFGSNPGDTFNALLKHNTRRSTWEIRYRDETTTTQDVLLNDRASVLIDNNGDPILDPITNDPIIVNLDGLNLRNDVFNRKRLDASVSYNTGKSTFRLQLFNEDRDSEVGQGTEKGTGTNFTWNWRFAPRTESIFTANWRTDETGVSTTESDFFDASLNLVRRVSRRTTANVLIRHSDRDSDDDLNNYTENRLTAGVRSTF